MPILIVQGEDDQYGTVRQIEIAQEECYCPVDVALLPGVKHQPQREGTDATLKYGHRLSSAASCAADEPRQSRPSDLRIPAIAAAVLEPFKDSAGLTI